MDVKLSLQTPVEKLFMVGPIYAKRLKKLGIKTAGNLLYHFPFRYENYSKIVPINQVKEGEPITISGTVARIQNEFTKIKVKKITTCVVNDGTGEVHTIWFNQPFLTNAIKTGDKINLSGKVETWGRRLRMISPQWEIKQVARGKWQAAKNHELPATSHEPIHTGRLVPVYPETYGVSSKWLRSRIFPILQPLIVQEKEWLPILIKHNENLIDIKTALNQIHFPDDAKNAKKARERFAFEEIFLLQLEALERRKEWKREKISYQLSVISYQEKINKFIKTLPFELTRAQKICVQEILKDLEKKNPMNRLLEGDVGSGKTVVAAIAMYATFLNGFQSALMAPTEILAHQHFQTLNQLLSPLGIKIALQTGAHKDLGSTHNLKPTTHNYNVIVGTHALLSNSTQFEKLALVVIDEQHRFGVAQRAQLKQKGGTPHLLTMTATPIPRTVALTFYGDLDLSLLNEMPKGRQKVQTWVVEPKKRKAAYEWIRNQIKKTESQTFVICPLIEESESLKSVKAATVEFDRLRKEVFPDLKLGLLHGRMKSKEKNEVLEQFKKGRLDILVATPVVEVGIDVPEATIMVIEGAERFGLAQLHQLRGRVGRGKKKSYCLLFSSLTSTSSHQRLKAMEVLHIGGKLAEIDLKMRGPGQIFGTAQHGFPELKVASFSDLPMIQKARKAAQKIFIKDPELKKHPLLKERLKQLTISEVEPD